MDGPFAFTAGWSTVGSSAVRLSEAYFLALLKTKQDQKNEPSFTVDERKNERIKPHPKKRTKPHCCYTIFVLLFYAIHSCQ